jgi:LmbE family N-acetylglucosaminyl deacetylase
MSHNKRVLSLLAHPDDAEFLCAGTLALLRQKGWEVHIATSAKGNCGSAELGADEIQRIRYEEGTNAAKIIGASYHCLGCDDIFVLYDRPTIRKAIELFRRVRPDLVLTHSPSDYMLDHEITSRIAQTASFCCGIRNIEIDGVEPFEPTPYLYYLDPVEGKDRFGQEVVPNFLVDISSVIETKEKMLCAHASQREWLMSHQGMDEYTQSMRDFSGQQGKRINCDYAEGFRQHLGHGYRQDNILEAELNKDVHHI